MLLVNLLAALNFANVFLNEKNVWKIKKKTFKNVRKRDQNKKERKNPVFCVYSVRVVREIAERARLTGVSKSR